MKESFFLFFLTIIFLNIISVKNDPTEEQIKEAINRQKLNMDDIKKMKTRNVPPSVVVFYFEPDKINERKMYAHYLKEFLSTFGMTVTQFIYGRKDELIATLQVGDSFDKNYVLKTFKGVIRDVLIKDFTKDL